MEIEEIWQDLILVARTKDVSPPSLEMLLAPLVGELTSMVVDKIRRRIISEHHREILLSRLFGFCKNADFIIGVPGKRWEIRPWSNPDVEALEDALVAFSKLFASRPVVYEREPVPDIKPDMKRNIVAFGSPISCSFTREVMGIERPSDISPFLPYSFNLLPPDGREISFPELKKTWINNSIMRSDATREEIYIPEYYEVNGKKVIRRDYGMIIKRHTVVPEAIKGRRNLVLAGCHEFGTVAAARALGNLEILNKVWAESGDRDFQAIVMCDVSEDESEHIELLEVHLI